MAEARNLAVLQSESDDLSLFQDDAEFGEYCCPHVTHVVEPNETDLGEMRSARFSIKILPFVVPTLVLKTVYRLALAR
jgi:hypothetical protein